MAKIEATANITLWDNEYDEDGNRGFGLEEKVIERAAEILADRIDKESLKGIQKKADQIVHDRVASEIEEVLKKPWQQTDPWGSPVGNPCTLADLIRKKLDETTGNGWGEKRQPRINELVEKAVKQVLNDEMKDVIPQVKEQFKTAIDGTLTAQIRKALADGLGIRA